MPTWCRAIRRRGVILLGLPVLWGCGDQNSPIEPPAGRHIEATAPAACTAGDPLAGGIAGRVVTDAAGEPVANVTVYFRLMEGDGALTATSASSGADGIARIGFTCGPAVDTALIGLSLLPGDAANPLLVGVPVLAGPASGFQLNLPDSVAEPQATSLDLAAVLGDRFGNPIAGTAVTWTIEVGTGSLERGTTTTDLTGATANRWLPGPSQGMQAIRLAVPGTSVSQVLHIQAFVEALHLVPDNPPDSVVVAGAEVSRPYRVRVVTESGAAVRRAAVQFEVHRTPFPGAGLDFGVFQPDRGSGTWRQCATPCSLLGVLTDAEGFAAARYTAPTKTGQLVIGEVLPCLGCVPPAEIAPGVYPTLAVDPGAVASLVLVSGDGQSGVVGQPLLLPLVVRPVDQYGNATCREPVTWSADHGGTLADDVTSPDPCDASNRWTLGPDPGSQTVTATAAPGVSVTFSATASP